MNINAQHHRLIILLLTGVLIFWFGRLSIQYEMSKNIPPLQIVSEINPKIPMVTITDINDGKVTGTVNKPEIRIKSGESVAVPDEFNEFELDIQHLGYIGEKRQIIKITVPDWAKFVASKNGKYYYELDEASAKNLSVETRVYFANEAAAIEEGYLKRER